MTSPATLSVLGLLAVGLGGACWSTRAQVVSAEPGTDSGADLASADLADVPAADVAGPDLAGDAGPDAAGDSAPDLTGDSAPDLAGDSGRDAGSDTPMVVCPSPVLKEGNTSRTLMVGSTSRGYVLHVPRAYNGTRPVPLILDFHSIGSSGSAELDSSTYPAVTDAEGVIMAFPDGLKGPAGTAWNLGPCCVEDVDDLQFATALVKEIKTIACIDARRVYAIGSSTGGGMASYLACHAADVFAAVAPAGFAFLEGTNVNDCRPSRGITVISFRGTAEVRVPYGGGPSNLVPKMPVTFYSAEATFEKWAELDGCTGSATIDTNGCSHYDACRDGAEVILCAKQGGREEPSDASVGWPVLKRHTLP